MAPLDPKLQSAYKFLIGALLFLGLMAKPIHALAWLVDFGAPSSSSSTSSSTRTSPSSHEGATDNSDNSEPYRGNYGSSRSEYRSSGSNAQFYRTRNPQNHPRPEPKSPIESLRKLQDDDPARASQNSSTLNDNPYASTAGDQNNQESLQKENIMKFFQDATYDNFLPQDDALIPGQSPYAI